MINYSEDSDRGSVMMKKSSFMFDPLMQLSGFRPERLIQLSFLMICKDVNIPDKSGDILTRSDAWSLAIPALLVYIDLFSIIKSNLLIIKVFCQYFVDKRFELRSEVSDKTKNRTKSLFLLCGADPAKTHSVRCGADGTRRANACLPSRT